MAGGRFGVGALLGVLLFVPAGWLVSQGQLSAGDAVVRFGLAWVVAVVAVAVLGSVLVPSPPVRPVPVPSAGAPVEPAAPEDASGDGA
ncbi:hypothetical protein [Phycicoccus sp.]|uniref:hypothetical protein n=1 Tax=Phycicoccus sp. TaxID=1902410 RepID=UPI002BD4CC01|nr:hypothetical protein [Phycicoccus sp.]HMM96128.1 hypothetical protein [Phycicoccus sp.]